MIRFKEFFQDTSLRWVLLSLLATKILYFSVVIGAVLVSPDFDERRAASVNANWFDRDAPFSDVPGIVRHFTTWDAQHYLLLSDTGYSEGLKSSAFYPLWPMTIATAALFTGGNQVIAGMLLANLFSLAAWLLFYRITEKRFGETAAQSALILLIAFPGSLFYQFIYSEPLFFLLVMLIWYGLEERHYRWVALAAFLLPLTRAIGLFALLPIAWHCLMHHPWSGLDRWQWVQRERALATGRASGAGQSGLTPVLVMIMPLVGFACYLSLMWSWTGNPFEGFQAQKHWGAHSITNLLNVPQFITGLINPETWHSFTGSLLDRLVFVFLLYMLPLIWGLGKDLLLWTFVLGIIPAMSGTFTSFTRFACCIFPIFIALAVFTERTGSRWVKGWSTTIIPFRQRQLKLSSWLLAKMFSFHRSMVSVLGLPLRWNGVFGA